jgi:hypothetical protein
MRHRSGHNHPAAYRPFHSLVIAGTGNTFRAHAELADSREQGSSRQECRNGSYTYHALKDRCIVYLQTFLPATHPSLLQELWSEVTLLITEDKDSLPPSLLARKTQLRSSKQFGSQAGQ